MTGRAENGKIALIVLAAGASSRMRGRDKLLEYVNGAPLLQQMVARAQETGGSVYVTLPDANHPRTALIGPATPVFVPDAHEGMSASIRRGIASLPKDVEAAMIIPGDMPELQATDFMSLLEAFWKKGGIIRGASATGKPGHPVLFPRIYFADLQKVSGDEGGRTVLRAHSKDITLVPLEGQRALTDLDTPEAWDAWRASQS